MSVNQVEYPEDWKAVLNTCKINNAAKDSRIKIVNTDTVEVYTDGIHFDSDGVFTLGALILRHLNFKRKVGDKMKNVTAADGIIFRTNFTSVWEDVDAVDVEITTSTGVAVDSGVATVLTPDALSSATDELDDSIVLVTGDSSIKAGDVFLIQSSAAGTSEVVTARDYNHSTKTILLTNTMQVSHSANAVVSAMFCEFEADLSALETGNQIVVKWVPTDDLSAITELYKIADSDFAIPDAEYEFSMIYPIEYEMISREINRFSALVKYETDKIKSMLSVRGRDISKMVDSDPFKRALYEGLCYQANKAYGGDQRMNERDTAKRDYDVAMAQLKELNLWEDENADLIQDADEVRPSPKMPPTRNYM
jgi:hypothetical protein